MSEKALQTNNNNIIFDLKNMFEIQTCYKPIWFNPFESTLKKRLTKKSPAQFMDGLNKFADNYPFLKILFIYILLLFLNE